MLLSFLDTSILQDVYCLNADGSLFDAALISVVAAFTHCMFNLLSLLIDLISFKYLFDL